jgi:hypothetical protein
VPTHPLAETAAARPGGPSVARSGLIGVSRRRYPCERSRPAAKRVSQIALRRRFVLTEPFAPRKKRQAVVRFRVKQPP